MNKIIVAPDKFRGSLSAAEAAMAIQEGILQWNANMEVICIPLADGGEGTAQAMVSGLGGNMIGVTVHDPLMRPVDSFYGLSMDGQSAFVEMSQACGLRLLNDEEKNCFYTTSYGTGELIAHALGQGVKKIYLGIGGSATNDAGLGMLVALGFQFFNHQGELFEPIGKNLQYLDSIDTTHKHERIDDVEFVLVNDVSNPLYGEKGAARVFAEQKGASPDEITVLDAGLKNFAKVVNCYQGESVDSLPGAGAGGGLAAGAKVFLDATMLSGIDVLIDVLSLEKEICTAQLVVTGEGKVDHQTLSGKVVHGLCQVAKKYDVPVAVLCGKLDLNKNELNDLDVHYSDSIAAYAEDMDDALEGAKGYLKKIAYEMMASNSIRQP